ncbi:uncharacterized protein LOC133841507 isoform X1 [Drosophila sulfurigaster albostrigata]|uniref:uncharacterized protein LOC133841507 isoform X1 n=1 Tax=Drosophila sulfurigaster albostrigata TaxID=89887 RepID=UPI002D21969E|nr:uncharacterized protein LOC133841507 isoform X1 [Drosophila sulfurigaster albostrigata]
MEQRNNYIMLLLILLLQIFCTAPGQAVFAVTKAECTPLDLNYCYFKHCEMRTDAKGQTSLNFHVAMRDKRPVNDVTMNIIFSRVTKAYRMQIINETFDFCAFMGQNAPSQMFHLINQHFNKYTNANHSCPYQHDIIYYGIDSEKFFTEIPAPKGNYILQMRVAANKKWRTTMKVYGTQN